MWNFVFGLREGVFKNNVLMRLFWPIGYEMTGGWIKLRNGKLNCLHSSTSSIRTSKVRWRGRVARVKSCQAYEVLVGKPQVNRLLARSIHKCENNITITSGKK